jgi:DNA repair photolyase
MTKTDNEAAANQRVHGTGEWAKSTVNIQCGCENDCRYCYAKAMAIRFGRTTADSWKTPALNQKALDKRYNRRGGRIMFPSTHDITQGNVEACLTVLKQLLVAGNDILIVSKPGRACVKRMCLQLEPYKARVLFRFTIGSADDSVLGYWEPGAPSFDERLLSLKHAYALGFATSVSMEPMLDSDPKAVIDAVSPYVTDSIWIGKANRLRQIVSLNCPDDKEALKRATALIDAQSDDAIIRIYGQYKDNPVIKWKDSIKKVVGLERPTAKGLDI